MKRYFAILVTALTALSAVGQKTYKNPVYNGDFPDPTVQRAPDGTFYAYATGPKCRKSKDLVSWTSVSSVISRPTWNDTTYVDANGQKKTDYYSFWACDVNYVDGKYLMQYACALWGNGSRTGIGVAVGDSPEKFTDKGKMFRSTEIGVNNSIDPCYIEEFDKKYIAWGSFNDIYIAELTDDGLQVKDFRKKTKIGGGAFEGTMIYKRGNYYYLFASVGSCCEGENSTYRTVVGRSTKLTGPYTNKQGGTMFNNNYTTIISGTDRWKGPGHNSEIITDDNGDDWLLYHCYDRNNNFNGRLLLLDKITWSSDGWPTINDGHPSSESMPAPVFYTGDGANLTYKFNNMDLMKSGWKGWNVTASEDCEMQSGRGSAFMPLGYAKTAGTFDASQTVSGVRDGIYEMSLYNYASAGGVDLYVNGVATPAFNPVAAGVTAPTSETVISSNFLRANNKYEQHVYGLVIGGKVTVGMRSRGQLSEGERYYAGGVKVIYREKNAEAVTSVLNSYYQMADEAKKNSKTFYRGYSNSIDSYHATADATTDASARYNLLVKIYHVMDSINTSIDLYQNLETEIASMQAAINKADEGGYGSDDAKAVLKEAQTVLAEGTYTNVQVPELIKRMQQAIHDMNYAYQQGDGTAANPYIITRPEHLDHMREVFVKEQMTYFAMDADVDMKDFVWQQLNSSSTNYRFWMNFDGRGHIIYNLTPEGSKSYPSFAGVLCGEIRNVGFVDAMVDATATGAGVVCGQLGHASYVDAEGNPLPIVIENCYFTGKIISKGYVGTVGGTMVTSPVTIRNCYSAVDIEGNGGSANYSGGLVGRIRSDLTIQNCYAAGIISSPIAGGVVAGGQNSTTPASVYNNVIAWNPAVSGNTALPFGSTVTGDDVTYTYYLSDMLVNDQPVEGGKSHAELQSIAASWGAPWYKDPSAGNGYPILQWQFERGDYEKICGFEYDPTAIHNVLGGESVQGKSAIFNLSGQRVDKPQHGIYIVNGRKVFFK